MIIDSQEVTKLTQRRLLYLQLPLMLTSYISILHDQNQEIDMGV